MSWHKNRSDMIEKSQQLSMLQSIIYYFVIMLEH